MQSIERLAGSVWYQSHYEPRFPAEVVRHLVRSLSLDGDGRLLDIDCGTGELALRLADWFEGVIAVEPEWEQVMEARRQAIEGHADRVRFLADPAHLEPVHIGQFRVVAVRSDCRWLGSEGRVERLAALVADGGALAAVGCRRDHTPEWQALAALVERYDGGLGEGDDIDLSAEIERELPRDRFDGAEHVSVVVEDEWTADRLIGYLYAVAGLGPRRLGDRQEEFERAVDDFLAERGGRLAERRTVELGVSRRR
jgi:SAM-dependent methyltransferase